MHAFAVLLFGSLLYVHPYGGLHKSLPTLLRRAEARCSILRAEVQVPRAAVHWRVLPDDLLGYFERVFEKDERSCFFPPRLLDLRWSLCKCGLSHARPVCPACASLGVVAGRMALRVSGGCTGRTIVRTHGRILAAAVQGGVQYLVEEDGLVRRENGEVVLREPRQPGMVFVTGRPRHLGGSRAPTPAHRKRARHGAHQHRHVSGPPGLRRLAAGTPSPRRRLADGRRHAQRIDSPGADLDRRRGAAGRGLFTAPASSPSGFCFAAGAPGLTALALPPIDGRLIDLTAVFDDQHALIGVATEKNGHRTHALYLIDEVGKVRARATGAPDSARMLTSIHGKALKDGRVVCLTDEGLPRWRWTTRPASSARGGCSPTPRRFAPPTHSFWSAPAGSLYVVTTQEIVQLTIQ